MNDGINQAWCFLSYIAIDDVARIGKGALCTGENGH